MDDIIFKATTRGGRNFIEVIDTGTDIDRYMIKQDGAVDYANTTREVLAYLVKQSGWKEGTFDKIEIDTDHIGEQYLAILKMINKEFGFLYKSPKGSPERQYYFDIIRFIAQNIKNGADMAIEDMIWKAKDALERKGINSSRKISSSQKGFENVAEGTRYDDYYIDTRGMGILDVENIIDAIEGRGNQAVLTVQSSDGSVQHTYFTSKTWKDYKDTKNNSGVAITDVWITEVKGGSYVRNSRRPIKSGRLNVESEALEKVKQYGGKRINSKPIEILEILDDGEYSAFLTFTFKSGNDVYEMTYDYGFGGKKLKPSIRKIQSSRQIKSDWERTDMASGPIWDKDNWRIIEKSDYDLGTNTWGEEYYMLRDKSNQRAKDIRFNTLAEAMNYVDFRTNLNSSRQIKSARYIATDPETGEVLGSADTYEEAVNEWGEDVTITDSEAAEGQEEGGLFSNRQIKSSMFDDENEIELSSDKPNYILRMFDHNGGNIFAEEGFDTKAEAIKWASENGKGFDAALWDNINGKSVKEWKIKSSRKITSAVDGGWEVRSSDVPEALDLFVEYFGEEDALEEIAKAMGDDVLQENIEWIAQQWGFGEEIEGLDVWEQYEMAKEYMGVSELFNNLTQSAGYDELAADLAFIFRMNDFREWDKYDNENEKDEVSDSVNSSKKPETTKQFVTRILSELETGEITEDDAAEEIAESNDVNIGYARQILSSYIADKDRYITSGMLELGDALNVEFDPDGNLDSWSVDFATDPEKPAPTLGGELVRAARYIISAFRDNDEKVGWGYAREVLNPAARFIVENTDYKQNDVFEDLLDGQTYNDDAYRQFIDMFETDFADYLRDHEELFRKLNKKSFEENVNDEDEYNTIDYFSVNNEHVDYWFRYEDGQYVCDSVDPVVNQEWNEGDIITAEDFPFDNIDFNEEYGTFDYDDGFIYSWEDGDGESVRISNVEYKYSEFEEGDVLTPDELENLAENGYEFHDTNGNEIRISDIM